MTYTEANERLGRRQSLRLPGRYTRLMRLDDGSIAVRLCDTYVVKFRPCGRVILDRGNWRTMLTKDRINAYSGIQVWSENGQWYADDHPFYDGITFKEGRLVR